VAEHSSLFEVYLFVLDRYFNLEVKYLAFTFIISKVSIFLDIYLLNFLSHFLFP